MMMMMMMILFFSSSSSSLYLWMWQNTFILNTNTMGNKIFKKIYKKNVLKKRHIQQKFQAESDIAGRIYDFGRLLMTTEVRSAHRYWHVKSNPALRVYPDIYQPKVVGMLWSTLAQQQTWFGAEPVIFENICI
jgi:hypothetical protein